MHGVPVWVALRECAPLTARRPHIEDRFDDVALVVHGWPAHPAIPGEDGNETGDERPLLASSTGQIAVRCSPRSTV